MYEIGIETSTGEVRVLHSRTSAIDINALPFLEPPAKLNLDFENLELDPVHKIIEADVAITHPFPGKKVYMGFDVKGILITKGNQSVGGYTWAGDGDVRLVNADGYTNLFNPSEFPQVGDIYSYVDGLLAPPNTAGHYNATMNPYKLFADSLGISDTDPTQADFTTRFIFRNGKTNRRHYIIDYSKPQNWLWFNYAVAASWTPPQVKPPQGPDDFPPSANSSLAFGMKAVIVKNSLWFNSDLGIGGGALTIDLSLYHHTTGWNSFEDIKCSHWNSGIEGEAFETTHLGDADIVGEGDHFTTFRLDLTGSIEPESLDDIDIAVVCINEQGNRSGFFTKVGVSEQTQGLNLDMTVNLPLPLPITDEKDFSLRGETGDDGIYYVGGESGSNYVIFRYPLDYSSGGVPWDYIGSPKWANWEEPEYVLGPINDLARFDISPSNSYLFSTRCADGFDEMWPPIRKKSFVLMWDDIPGTEESPNKIEHGQTLNPEYTDPNGTQGNHYPVDIDAGYGTWGDIVMALMIPDPLGPVPSTVDFVSLVFSEPPYIYDESDDESSLGLLIPGPKSGPYLERIDKDHSVAIAIDTDSDGNGFHFKSGTILYVAENILGAPDIEVLTLEQFWWNAVTQDSFLDYYFNDPITSLHGESVIDISLFNAMDAGYSTDVNWVAVLEGASGGGWFVELFSKSGVLIDSTVVYDGTPIHLDVDSVHYKIHVWHTASSIDQTLKASVFSYSN